MQSVPIGSAGSNRPIAVLVDREGLGDALLKLPFLRAVARGFPSRPIWWIAVHQTAMADDLRPFVSGWIAEVRPHADISGLASQVGPRLAPLPAFSLVFDTRSRIATVWSTRRRLRCEAYFCCLPGYWLSARRPPGRFMRPRHIGLRALSMAEAALGGTVDAAGELACGDAAQALARSRLPDGPTYVGLAVGSREARKNWPIAHFVALAREIMRVHRTPVFLVGPQERPVLAALREALPGSLFPEADPVDPSLGLARLELAIAIARRLSVAVANDSGIGHLLGAVGTPLVSLFGPTDAARWAPFAKRAVVIRAQDFGGTSTEAIPVGAVCEAVARLLAPNGE